MILLCMTHFMYAANAQQKDTSSFLFDEFQNAVVIFKDGSQYHEKMNYNILLEKFFFIDRADQTKKILSNPQDVRVIQFGNRVFYMEGDKGIEIIPINPTLYVQYKGNIRKEASKGAYGQASETTYIRTYGGIYGNGGERFEFDPEKLILGNRYNNYWIERKGKKKSFKNFKQFIKLYPDKKEEIEKFIENNRIDFNNVEQIKTLCIYVEPSTN